MIDLYTDCRVTSSTYLPRTALYVYLRGSLDTILYKEVNFAKEADHVISPL